MNKKLKNLNIKLLILDVDGVLTDGKLYYSDEGVETKAFHVHDGQGLQLLIKDSIDVAIISGRNSKATQKRLDDLGIKHVYLGISDKNGPYNQLKEMLKIEDENIAYVGDDLPDLTVMKQVGFSIAVANATKEILEFADLVLEKKGGDGAVREACELILSNKT